MRIYITSFVFIIATIPFFSNAMEQKAVVIDINDITANLVGSFPIEKKQMEQFKLFLPPDLEKQDKERVCAYLPTWAQQFPEKYNTLEKLLTLHSDEPVTRGRKQKKPNKLTNEQLMEKQLLILQVVTDAFKKIADEAEQDNKIKEADLKETKKQNKWERKSTIACGVSNIILGCCSVGLGIATVVLSVAYSSCENV